MHSRGCLMDDPYIDNTTERSMNDQARKALELARYSCNALNDTEALAAIDAALSAPKTPVANSGWMRSGALLYRLTDDRKPVNRDEIRVTMADGSRTDEACSRLAGELFDMLAAAPAAQMSHLETIATFHTAKAGRTEVATFFREHLKRHDFSDYIMTTLAADFACALAPTLHALRIDSPAAPVAPSFDLLAHIRRHMAFSERTFGPGPRAAGVIDHIRKELREIEAAPHDLEEWIDVLMLALDGAWRSGATPDQIVAQLVAKQTKNEGRVWPDWRTAEPGKAIEHDRSHDAPFAPVVPAPNGIGQGGAA